MIDQADFGSIDEYIKRHGLQDSSLAEARRAKVYNVNVPKNNDEAAAAETTGAEEESELQKAQRELEDQEDEDEEDYDPGSEGESEGSGSSSDDESEDEFHENGENVSDGDLVKEELGSETEDAGDDDDDE